MAISISNAAASAAAAAILALIDAGVGPGTVEIRSGAKPANVETADSGTLLVEVTFDDPAFAAPVNGVAAAGTITGANAVAGGTAGHYRVKDSDGNAVFDGTVGVAGSGADMELITTTIVAGQPVEITSFTFTQPKA
jgi:hypothetical protein